MTGRAERRDEITDHRNCVCGARDVPPAWERREGVKCRYRSIDPLRYRLLLTAWPLAAPAAHQPDGITDTLPLLQSRVSCETTIDVGESITQHNTLF